MGCLPLPATLSTQAPELFSDSSWQTLGSVCADVPALAEATEYGTAHGDLPVPVP